MTTLLILAVLVLVAIAIWQMTKIFELSQIKAVDSQIANDADNKYNGYLLFIFLIFIYGITIFSFGNMERCSCQRQHPRMEVNMIT